MFERVICFIVAILSLFSVIYSSKHMDMYSDLAYVQKSNYVDVYFTDVQSMNGSSVSLTSNQKTIQVDSILLDHVGDQETIQYEIYNNSFAYDVDVEVYVNGVKDYQDNYFIFHSDPIESLKSGETKIGTITIECNQGSVEKIDLPFEVEFKLLPKQKGYLG